MSFLFLSLSLILAPRLTVFASPVQRPLDQHFEVIQSISQHSHNDEFILKPTAEYAFSGITTFHRLPERKCLQEDGVSDDILIIGVPFDTATSYRSGTRFGPNGIRQGSRAVALMYALPLFHGLKLTNRDTGSQWCVQLSPKDSPIQGLGIGR